MCRNIRPLHNYDPPTSEEEVQAAALQYVRKISGMNRPARANEEAFERAVQAVTEASTRLLRVLLPCAGGVAGSRCVDVPAAPAFAAPALAAAPCGGAPDAAGVGGAAGAG